MHILRAPTAQEISQVFSHMAHKAEPAWRQRAFTLAFLRQSETRIDLLAGKLTIGTLTRCENPASKTTQWRGELNLLLPDRACTSIGWYVKHSDAQEALLQAALKYIFD